MNLPPVAASPAISVHGRGLLRLLGQMWDRLAIYLPLVLMGLLALVTYWMVRITPSLPEAREAKAQVHEVDFFMRGAVVKAYDGRGRLQNQLTGEEMRHYADNATIEVDQPRWQGLSAQGRITRARAQRGLSKDDGSEVQLIGQAVVMREAFTNAQGRHLPQQEFRGEFLHIFADDERLRSHLPVEFTSGGDRFTADSFSYDHQSQVVELQGRVKARIEPAAAPRR